MHFVVSVIVFCPCFSYSLPLASSVDNMVGTKKYFLFIGRYNYDCHPFLLCYFQGRLQQYEAALNSSPEDPTALEVSLYPFNAVIQKLPGKIFLFKLMSRTMPPCMYLSSEMAH